MQKAVQFIKEVYKEFKNITWPKKETLIQLTIVVISISIVVSIILGGLDYIFTNALTLLDKTTTQPQTQIEEVITKDAATESATPNLTPQPTIKQ